MMPSYGSHGNTVVSFRLSTASKITRSSIDSIQCHRI
uniref:Uncharacterized protein n=1 Tax=Oryza rufipogon TaxID=4529 RepID=A0A0E0PYD0_ORYRU